MGKSKISEGSAVVVKTTGSRYTLKKENGSILECNIKGKFRQEGIRITNPAVVGDQVSYEIHPGHKTGIITAISERKNFIVRKASKLSKYSQIIAANIDQALLIVSLVSPETHLEFIDRFLVSAEAYRIPVIIVFNKIDLYSKDKLKKMKKLKEIYQKAGYSSLEVSAKDNLNMEEVKNCVTGKINLFSGNSGVGKSTLINKLDPSLDITTAEISEYHQVGKHTTTFAEMHELYFGGFVIDTPGIKGFGMVHMEKEEIYHFFPEIFKKAKECKYYNCKHINEPGCAVLDAVEKGEVSISRYQSYRNLFLDEDSKYR